MTSSISYSSIAHLSGAVKVITESGGVLRGAGATEVFQIALVALVKPIKLVENLRSRRTNIFTVKSFIKA